MCSLVVGLALLHILLKGTAQLSTVVFPRAFYYSAVARSGHFLYLDNKRFYITKLSRLFPCIVRTFKLTEVISRLDLETQFTLSDTTHIWGFIFV